MEFYRNTLTRVWHHNDREPYPIYFSVAGMEQIVWEYKRNARATLRGRIPTSLANFDNIRRGDTIEVLHGKFGDCPTDYNPNNVILRLSDISDIVFRIEQPVALACGEAGLIDIFLDFTGALEIFDQEAIDG